MTQDFSSDGRVHPSDLAPGLFTARLKNGLRVVIKEDHRSAVAICNAWVGTGSNREPEALRGWSHGTEHLLFKGTARRGEGDFAREVAEAGGSTNAGTGYESTNYHITLPAEQLPVAVDILSDALFHSAFEPAALDAEREVLVHENHMYDDVPFGYGVTWRWGMELNFDVSPYRHPIGGRDENLRERSRDQILAYWRSAYRPDNTVVVAVGDFEAAAAFALIQEKFGAVEAAPPAPPESAFVENPPTEPRHEAPRLRSERGDLQKCYAKLIFPAPGEKQDRRQVMNVITQILTEGRSSRLYREVQERHKLVEDFVVMGEAGPREGIMVIDLETDAARLPEALKATCAILEDLKQTGGTEAELQRARIRVLRHHIFGAETVQGQAGVLGHYALLDDLEGAFTFPERIAQVTRQDIAEMAAQVFALSQLGVMIYAPEGAELSPQVKDAAALQRLLRGVLGDGAAPSVATSAALTDAPVVRTTADPLVITPFKTLTGTGGAEISFRIDRTLPVFALTFMVQGGACRETASTCGLAALTAAVQAKSAGGMDSETLYGRLEAEGASLSPNTERDYSGMVLSGLSSRMDVPLEILADLILKPDFPAAEIEQERRLALEELAAYEDTPLQLGMIKLRTLIYGDHPYGRPLVGTPESLAGFNRAQILAAHAQAWTTGNMRITLAGDIDPEIWLPKLDKILETLPRGDGDRPVVGAARIPNGVENIRLKRKIAQCVLLMGWPGPHDPNEDRPARMLLQEVLNGQSGRLFDELRNKRSLCYNCGVMATAGFGQGMFLGYVLTAPEAEAEARDAMLSELARLQLDPVPEGELNRVRTKLIGNLLIANQSNYAKASRAAANRMYGRQADDMAEMVQALRDCTPADLQTLAGTLFNPISRFEVVLGPGE